MNEFEDKLVTTVVQGLHDFEVKMAETIGEIRGDIKALTNSVDKSIEVDTKRLDKHAQELDTHRERLSTLEEWKEQFEKQVNRRLAGSQSISTIAAVVIAYLLSKFL